MMSRIIIHDPGVSTPEFNNTIIVIPSAGKWIVGFPPGGGADIAVVRGEMTRRFE
jgi:hypothetical protein